jgi:hypothetical protein
LLVTVEYVPESAIPRRFATDRAARWTFCLMLAALLPLMVAASFDFGVTWDEHDRHTYGVKVWEFLRGLRERSSFAETGGHVYPGLFDTLCAALESWVPLHPFVLRHVVNAIFGWIGIVYSGRLAARLFGPWAGVLAVVLLGLAPRYFAASMNNPKDLPFAAMAMMALYYISTVSPRWPYLPPGAAIKITISIALALNIRVGALLYLGYLGLLVAAIVIADRCSDWRRLAITGAQLAAIAVAVLLIGTIFWPWAGAAPLTRPFQALVGAAGYRWEGFVLFNGFEYDATRLPWYYAPWWFIISTQPAVLVGAACSILFVFDRQDRWRRIALWFVVSFPLVTAIVMRSTLYDGVRHLMFLRPVLVVLAVGGWAQLLQRHPRGRFRTAAALVLAWSVGSVLVFDVRFHPNQGVYFNSLVGGPAGAYKRYEMDYWGNCVLQGVEWAANVANSLDTTVRISGNPAHIVLLDAQRFPRVRFISESENSHHMYINTARGLRSEFRNVANDPALYRVRTPDGAVLCSVVAGPAIGELGRSQPLVADSVR